MKVIKQIIWDFDGVIFNSNKIRDLGFREALKNFDVNQVEKFIVYHKKNGGLSRYVKFRYFFEKILNRSIDLNTLDELLSKYSQIMKENLFQEKLIITETYEFIKNNYSNIEMHIVSASDEKELNELIEFLNMKIFFKSIKGSPKTKIENVRDLILNFNYNSDSIILIGDSNNDFEAAQGNNIKFYGYNNKELFNKGYYYIDSFDNLLI